MAADGTSRDALIERVAKTLHADGGITEDLMPGTCSRCVQSIATATDIVDAVVMPLAQEREQLTRDYETAHDAEFRALRRAEAAEAERDLLEAERDQALAELGRRK